MKANTLRSFNVDELKSKLNDLIDKKIALETERIHKKIIEKPGELRKIKRDIAKLKAILKEKLK